MPENAINVENSSTSTGNQTLLPKKTLNIGNNFQQQRIDILRRLKRSVEQCQLNYSDRKELASEKDDTIVELCDCLEEALFYGLRSSNNGNGVTVSAVALFQNMQEIVTGNTTNENTFWDFCMLHLTPHEQERFTNLKCVTTKYGRGRAFIRATLNENSLQRYLLTWLYADDNLRQYYTPWSLLMDTESWKSLQEIIGNLDKILFALTIDAIELNNSNRNIWKKQSIRKEEPIIYAPKPLPMQTKTKCKKKPIERPITTNDNNTQIPGLNLPKPTTNNIVYGAIEPISNIETSLLFESLNLAKALSSSSSSSTTKTTTTIASNTTEAADNFIEPDLSFLDDPLLTDFKIEQQSNDDINSEITIELDNDDNNDNNDDNNDNNDNNDNDDNDDGKSETSSQYSKSSSLANLQTTTSAKELALEEKLREISERCILLETRVAQLSLEKKQLERRLKQFFNETGIDPSSSLATNYLITIPQVKLHKPKHGSSYYVYEVHITMRYPLEHWIVMRRYNDFDKLHKSLLRTHYSLINGVEFPTKKLFGNKNLVFVEERRQQLQIYLLNLIESLPQVEACKTRNELQKVFPFFREK